jgi:FlaA1/EpsC-like NDP-sugar epimerase
MQVHRLRPFEAVLDALAITAALILAYVLRFDAAIQPRYVLQLQQAIAGVVIVKLTVFYMSGIYDKWWRYASAKEMQALLKGVALSSVAVTALMAYLLHPLKVPRSIPFIDFLLTFAFVAGWRFILRLLFEHRVQTAVRKGDPVLIVGAGDAGEIVVRDLLKNPDAGYNPVGFIDDDPRKRNMSIHGIRVVGSTAELDRVLDRYPVGQAIIAMPSVSRARIRDVVFDLEKHHVDVQTVPSVWEMVSGQVSVSQLRHVDVEDVLGRDPVDVDFAAAASYLKGKTVMVTGAGGSIGAELCRQIAAIQPAKLVLVDHAELALFSIEHELTSERHAEGIVPVLADVKNEQRMDSVFSRWRPSVVFHAAAYKHVPMMEHNPEEAVKNNIIGTSVVARMAREYGADRFVLVSTDKAVNPQTIMGASKAMAERLVRAMATEDETKFIIVRFGNVLGSSGSVVPIFKRQIARGGPVTVTHPDMTRFFMTIPEAVSLVVQAGALGAGGEVFVLDMGEPMKILELAYNMIRLSGLEPERDVKVEFTGVRPGEKISEELFESDELPQATPHPKIVRADSKFLHADVVLRDVSELERLAIEGDGPGIRECLKSALPHFTSRTVVP